jgi:hypothetical protein
MKILALVLAISTLPLTAAAQETMDRGTYDTQIRDLQQRSEQLGSDIFRSRTALSVMALEVLEQRGTARLAVVQEDRMGPLYRLVRAVYAIDGTPVFTQSDPDGIAAAGALEIYDGAITTGEHLLTVRLEYVGAGGRVFDYLEGYHFVIRSSHRFTTPDGRALRIRVLPYERETVRSYVDRPWIGYVESLGN